MEGPGADSEEKRVPASDVDTVMVDSLKALDPNRPLREADIGHAVSRKAPVEEAGALSEPLFMNYGCCAGPICGARTGLAMP